MAHGFAKGGGASTFRGGGVTVVLQVLQAYPADHQLLHIFLALLFNLTAKGAATYCSEVATQFIANNGISLMVQAMEPPMPKKEVAKLFAMTFENISEVVDTEALLGSLSDSEMACIDVLCETYPDLAARVDRALQTYSAENADPMILYKFDPFGSLQDRSLDAVLKWRENLDLPSFWTDEPEEDTQQALIPV